MHKAFFINLFYELLVGKENWETYAIFTEDIFQRLCLCHLAFVIDFFCGGQGAIGNRREVPFLNQRLEFSSSFRSDSVTYCKAGTL